MKSFIRPKETFIDLGSENGSFIEKTQVIGMSPLITQRSPKKINLNKTSRLFGDAGDSLD